jgi:hypothetical protein
MPNDLINEEQIPGNWEPVSSAPVVPGQPAAAPPVPNDMPQFFTGSMPPALQHDTVFVGTEVGSPAIPKFSLMPLGNQSSPFTNAASQSTTTKIVTVQTSGGFSGVVTAANVNGGIGASVNTAFLGNTTWGFVYRFVESNSTVLPQEPTIRFLGFTVADNPGNLSTDVTFGGASWSTITSGANTQTGAFSTAGPWTFSVAGAASTPTINLTGAPYTAGTATTNVPLLYVNDGTAPTTWSTAGTEFGINAPSGFTGNFVDLHVNGGASVASVDYQGNLTVSAAIVSSTNTINSSGIQTTLRFLNNANGTAGLVFGASSDTNLSRGAAGVVSVGTGAAGSTAGSVEAAVFETVGTKFTATGCTAITATAGGATAGRFTIGANSCTVVITLNGATGFTANNGWSCHANDQTTPAGNTGLYFSSNTATTATLTVPSSAVALDVIDFSCQAF